MEKYEKVKLIGRGAHGIVYLCKQKLDSKLVITKEIPVDQMSVEERQVSMNEAKVLSMLDHPNVVAYYDSFLEDKTMIIVMEYVQGGTLFDFLNDRNGNLMTEEEVLHYFGQMVYTLQHVHGKLILHRDLKSQNILMNERKNIIKIGDFGISKVLSTKSKAYTVVGTPCYISPELCEGKPYNQKSDIWALGCILYELMTLKRPFDATTLPALIMKIMKGSFEPVSSTYSCELRKLLLSMFHLEHNQRPSAAQIMCHPVMIKAIFTLYVDIGSIPHTKGSRGLSSSHEYLTSAKKSVDVANESYESRRNSTQNEKKKRNIWLFPGRSRKVLLPTPPNTTVRSVSLGGNQIIGIASSGLLISWTARPTIEINSNSQKAENEDVFYIPRIVDEKVAINIVSVACGENFTVCLSDNGVVYSFGKASSGCLGVASDKDSYQPRIVEALFSNNIKSIACGPKHVLVLSEENRVFAWGCGSSGCLGLGSVESQILPQSVAIQGKGEPDKVYCGVDCSFVVTKDRHLLVCGSNRHNKIALDTGEGSQTDAVNVFTSVKSEPIRSSKITYISAGKSHTVLLAETGDLYSVGGNRHGQLGWGKLGLDYSLPERIEKLGSKSASEIIAGDTFTLVVADDNGVFCWGKVPNSLTDNLELHDGEIHKLTLMDGKHIFSASCYAENCVIVAESE